ncbi:MAG TPA: hypothetical protein PLF32_06445 [Bacteroidales bacterium]|nr:hypothetical protein [Bacteroidales bacterium]HOR82278.1 hypothetical protein [Bacteroidales bacterium]HPJ91241.1 hypothetical protein [Bacteroidales bacterium]
MISYFYQNKGNFRVCEDSLTSTVFDLLKYLPIEIFWNILKKSLYHQKLPLNSGEILDFSYWTKWNANETDNSRYIEPDLFIRFEEFDLIIEAKRYNENQQNESQITKEIQSYINEFGNENKDLYFIQLGGLFDLNEVQDRFINEQKVVLCKSDWTKLLDQIVYEKDKLNQIDYTHTNSYIRILEDLIKGFEMHSFYKKIWLNSIEPIHITSENPKTLFNYVTKY